MRLFCTKYNKIAINFANACYYIRIHLVTALTKKKPKRLEVISPPQPFHCRFKPEARQKLVIRVYLTSALPSSYHHCDLFRQNSRVECFLYSSWWISLFFQWGGVSFVWHLMEHYQSQLPYLAFPTRHSVVANIFCVCIDFGCCCSQ